MKKHLIIKLVLLFCALYAQPVFSQGYNTEKTALTNFLVRIYKNAPFEGVRVVEDYDKNYLLSILSLDKSTYPNESVMNRVASVKAMSQTSRFFNGSNITSDLIIRTTESQTGDKDTEIIENIKENSIGYVKALEQLTNFTGNDNRVVFIFYKQLKQ